MTAVKWHEGPMVSLDFEATGTNPLEEHAVTAAIVHHTPGARPRTISWVIDPGVPVPDEAAAVHGWTTERLRRELGFHEAFKYVAGGEKRPLTKQGALSEIAAQVGTAIATETPLIIVNAAYDLTLLESELGRANLDTLADRVGEVRGVVDPQVIEKQYDPYRKLCYRAPGCKPQEQHHECSGCRGGKHKCGGCGAHNKQLSSLCSHYGIVHTGAHDAAGDALAGIRLSRRLAGLWPDIARAKLSTLHHNQIKWRRSQADGLRAYFDKNGIEHDGVDAAWPLHSSLLAVAA